MQYAPITPYRSGWLSAGDGHRIYWEECGNRDGWPVAIVHGGPGGRSTDRSRRWFHPDYFRIVTFDQRGCGRSTPHASIDHNTTSQLVSDLEALRQLLSVNAWIVMGQSWGAALAIAYAETFPERVESLILSSVFTARSVALEPLYPRDFVARCQAQLTGGNPVEALAAAHAWCAREDAVASATVVPPPADPHTALARARMGAHYFENGYFLDDGQLIAQAGRLRHIPGVIVHGRDDRVTPVSEALALHAVWPSSRLHVVADAGHSSCDLTLMRALMDVADSFLPAARARRPVTV